MNTAKISILKETFDNKFNIKRFRKFTRDFLNEPEMLKEARHTDIWKEYEDHIKAYYIIAKYTDNEDNDLIVMTVELKRNTSVDRARSMQRNFISKVLDNNNLDAAVVAFYTEDEPSWRLSFVRLDYTLTENGIDLKLTPAKRYSYLVGENEPNHTVKEQLRYIFKDDNHNPTLEDIQDVFSVEKVTKDFFNQYKEKYLELKETIHISFLDASIEERFCKKFLGQILFLYFLQKRGWLGVGKKEQWGNGDKNYIRNQFNLVIEKEQNFYTDFLAKLFRSLNDSARVLFSKELDCKVPFLNGDLFDTIGKYDVIINNSYFSNDSNTGLLDILDTYNFTVNENDPIEIDVGIDPEMLGEIFQRLLDVKERKDTGSFYTPKEIVHYMCQESLINYLVNECDKDYNFIKKFINECYNDFPIDEYSFQFQEKVEKALQTITVIDPAVGSGAFLLAMVIDIVKIRKSISPDKSNYQLKLETIENSIFGVDIQPSAVDIAKLRLNLTLIIDEKDVKKNPTPLPNLNYNICWGNSLIDEIEGIDMNDIDINSENILKLIKMEKDFFKTHTKKNKLTLKRKIEEHIVSIIAKTSKAKIYDIYNYLKMDNTHRYFLWKLNFPRVFKEKGGFDIVIGNPPYVGEKGNKEIFRPIANTSFGKKYYKGKMDLFYFFFHKGIDICREGGIIEFITTNYYTTANGATTLRLDFKNRTNVLKLLNFNELRIFESALGQHNLITLLEKGCLKENLDTEIVNVKKEGYADNRNLKKILENIDDETDYFIKDKTSLFDGEEAYMRIIEGSDSYLNSILNKISKGIKIGEICNVNQGIVSGADKLSNRHINKFGVKGRKGEGIFVLNEDEIREKNFQIQEKELLKPFYKNSDISRYKSNINTDKKIIYIDRKLKNIGDKFPNLEKHFRKYYPILSQRREVKKGSIEFFHLQWGRNEKIFRGEKIIAPQRNKLNTFAYNDNLWYSSADVYYITPKDNSIELKYLLAILNSKLYYIWFYYRGKRKGEALELYQTPLKETPVLLTKDRMNEIIELVDLILVESDENNRKLLETRIDKIIYQIYDLNDKEIKKIDEIVHKKGF
ncbi:Eco57I restriction-modification methylase domain-containing protein [Dethiothermospora halolimnae]|uniref:Eco57I restriction-modification methylase domain-containing protein n=1 Tax=Dethiothermospora halolimnae TaxID=3114390 RepID=UPI003CCC3221